MHFSPADPDWQNSDQSIKSGLGRKTAESVLGDFLLYLYRETKSHVKLHHEKGEKLWEEVKDRPVFVLGHPNGWKGVSESQQRYRNSMVLAGLIPDTKYGHQRIKFVTESEASVLTYLSKGLGPYPLEVR